MFLGEFEHSLDSKGRIILPAKFRAGLADGLVITKGMEKCLFIFSRAEWPQLEEKVRGFPFTKKDARKFSRFLFAGASEENLDKQGRIPIPQNLREYAELKKDVVIIGVSNRVEIWSKKNWDLYVKDAKSSYTDVAEDLTDLGL